MTAARNVTVKVVPPDLPEFGDLRRSVSLSDGGLLLDRVHLELDGSERLRADHVQITESNIGGLTLEAGVSPGLRFTDVRIRSCDLSNVDAREGSLTRVELEHAKLIGFSLAGGRAWDLRASDCSLALSSFAQAGLRDVVFERVNLREASFADARLENVEFIGCQLEGADFRGVRLKHCRLRGSPLDGIVGIESLRGLTMPWPDVIASAAALAHAIGIKIDEH